MRAYLEINMDNAAFGENGHEKGCELSRILKETANKISTIDMESGETIVIRDLNGNNVGELNITVDL